MSATPNRASMVRTLVAAWLYATATLATLITGGLLGRVLALYPPSHLASFGPVVPGASRAHAAWLPFAPTALAACAGVSVLVGVYLLRSRRPVEARQFAAMVIAFINVFLAMFCTLSLVVAYFYLPKLANAG